MYSQNKTNVILNIINKKPGLGKTAIMKIIFMLQQIKNIDMGYDFEIYIYGPYSSEVTEDIDSLIQNQFINSSIYLYSNYVGYCLSMSERGKAALSKLGNTDEKKINDILNFVDGKNAKELELCSTIIYVSNLYNKNNWADKEVISNVHEIKPHFDYKQISNAYLELKKENYI